MNDIFSTPKESVFYEDNKIYVATAFDSISKGHSVVVWKNDVSDINLLNSNDYEYLMDVVDVTRKTLIEFYNVEKVYLVYFDEAQHVHWHLVPRYQEKGFDVFNHKTEKINIFPDTEKLAEIFKKNHNKMILEN